MHPSHGESDICRGYLTDEAYLRHMIPHHQVAIDISEMHRKTSTSPRLQQVMRNLIRTQQIEICLMEHILKERATNVSDRSSTMHAHYIPTVADYLHPNHLGLSKTYCDPHFFNPAEHKRHLAHGTLDDRKYVEHMIPHHQVAVDMSKVLIQNTRNDFMLDLAYRIIRSQQDEIVLLNELLRSPYQHCSELVD